MPAQEPEEASSPEDPSQSANAEPESEAPALPGSADAASSAAEETGPAATTNASSASPEVLVVDDEPHIVQMLSKFLSESGLTVKTATSGEQGLEVLSDQTKLMLTDLKMSGMDGIEMIRQARKRGWTGKVMILTGYPAKETIVDAARLNVKDYVTKPFVPQLLLERIEETLQIEKPLHEVSADPDLREAILDPGATVPMLVPGGMELDLQVLEALAKEAAELLKQGALIPARDYYVVNDVQRAGDLSKRDPTLKKDQKLDEGAIRALARTWRDEYAGLVDQSGAAMTSIWVQKNKELGDHLTVRAGFDAEAFRKRLESHPLCAHVLSLARPEAVQAALTAIHDTWRHHEVIFLMHQLQARKAYRLINHLRATCFLALMNTQQELRRTAANLDDEDRRVVLAVVGTCGALHDLGWANGLLDMRFGSAEFLEAWKKHPAEGYNRVRNAPVYSEVKVAIRDHHKRLTERRSRYDCFTRIIQLASDLDNLVQGQGMVLGKRGPEPQASGVSPLQACQTLMLRAQDGVYLEESTDHLLSDCQFEALVNYYKQLEDMKRRPCKSVLLSPSAVDPVTALCRYGPGRAAAHKDKPYCDGCSGEKTHGFHGSFYHRCLYGHREVTQLNESIKHLSPGTPPQAQAAEQPGGAAESPSGEDASTGTEAGDQQAPEAGAPGSADTPKGADGSAEADTSEDSKTAAGGENGTAPPA